MIYSNREVLIGAGVILGLTVGIGAIITIGVAYGLTAAAVDSACDKAEAWLRGRR